MEVELAVKYVASKFKYQKDKKFIFDFWFVMRDSGGVFYGDCDDFTVTSLWEICERNLWKFIWYVFILHRYKMYRVKTINGGYHLVGCAEDLWFDNWTRRAMPKDQFFERTKHFDVRQVWSPVIMFFMFWGLFQR